jgi:hypothetical protein
MKIESQSSSKTIVLAAIYALMSVRFRIVSHRGKWSLKKGGVITVEGKKWLNNWLMSRW